MKTEKQSILEKLKKIITKKLLIYAGVVIALLFVLIWVFSGKGNSHIKETYSAAQKDVSRTVLASGKVISATDLSLSFQDSNIVHAINVSVGDKVKKGQVLASLTNDAQLADLTRAQGQLLGAKARYQKVIEGASGVDIAAAKDALANSKRTQDKIVENALRTLMSDDLTAEALNLDMNVTKNPVITGTYTGKTEGVYNLAFGISQSDLKYSGIESGSISAISLAQPLGTKGLTISFPYTTFSYNDEWVIKIPNKVGKNYTANLNSYNAALATRDEIIAAAQSKLDVLLSSARSVDINVAKADILVAEGGLAAAQASLEKTILRAPAEGTVTKIDIKLGDLASANVPVVTVQDISNLYVESNVNEENIIGVHAGQSVNITFGALEKTDIRKGELTLVNLGPSTNDGIVNYKVRALLSDSTNIRAGMTADLQIVTAKADGVIVIPTRFVMAEGDRKYVNILIDEKTGKTEQRTVTTGIKTDGSMLVITSGIKAGEKVVLLNTPTN